MCSANGKQWVMLVAGSKTWDNYRHQADVCHAYQIIHQNGIPNDQIVVMMYDDIAYNEENPYPGNIINQPNGPNVYTGVPKDYTGEDVTPENFLAALKGNRSAVKKSGPKKVITSGGNDTIFIYLSDHGATGMFQFPNNILHAYDLIETIKEMATNNKFSKMVIYMESCCSASMFNQLPNDINVYAVTAAEVHQSSYACYFDSKRKTYLADKFSAVWMHYNKANDLDIKTFQNQYSFIQEKVTSSCACCFGDQTVSAQPISVFVNNTPKSVRDKTKDDGLTLTHLTPNHEVPFKILEHRIQMETDENKKKDLIRKHADLHQMRAKMKETVESISQRFVVEEGLDEDYSQMDLHAFKTVAEHFRTTYFDETELHFALSHMHVFARLCAHGVNPRRIKEGITVSRRRGFHPH